MYLHRSIEHVLEKRSDRKDDRHSKHFHEFNYITLDDENMLVLAKKEPALFFKDQNYPLIIDKVQYAERYM